MRTEKSRTKRKREEEERQQYRYATLFQVVVVFSMVWHMTVGIARAEGTNAKYVANSFSALNCRSRDQYSL